MINRKRHYYILAKRLSLGIAETNDERSDYDQKDGVKPNKSGGVSFISIKTAKQMSFRYNQFDYGDAC